MPTLLYLNGFKFFFYANDHWPAHVHVLKGERWAKIQLSDLKVVHSSLKHQELRACLGIIESHRSEFLERWNAWFEG
ncbi:MULTISPECIES: DUF4160 domain-containing protein [unclassified Marinobacter]|uniref:DUF4160 domain-containing protein n=1 Tax=unclassified Marinobacter TaxID=83889 RepID=UPI00069FBC8F|nr:MULTISPECIES: DUF4160 domain-containing protein [unclassified Marinobacter]AKV95058.1 hypothetical protein ACP86_02145 [Marinobacter sp. CP1]MAK51992.1 DUF4160 domain-containing protein [Marinobacter sp.]MBI48051.1 DUF4160 domain-containing protein [Marinobacter sp.]